MPYVRKLAVFPAKSKFEDGGIMAAIFGDGGVRYGQFFEAAHEKRTAVLSRYDDP